MSHASRLVEAGRVRPHLDSRRFTLDSVNEIHYRTVDVAGVNIFYRGAGNPQELGGPSGNPGVTPAVLLISV